MASKSNVMKFYERATVQAEAPSTFDGDFLKGLEKEYFGRELEIISPNDIIKLSAVQEKDCSKYKSYRYATCQGEHDGLQKSIRVLLFSDEDKNDYIYEGSAFQLKLSGIINKQWDSQASKHFSYVDTFGASSQYVFSLPTKVAILNATYTSWTNKNDYIPKITDANFGLFFITAGAYRSIDTYWQAYLLNHDENVKLDPTLSWQTTFVDGSDEIEKADPSGRKITQTDIKVSFCLMVLFADKQYDVSTRQGLTQAQNYLTARANALYNVMLVGKSTPIFSCSTYCMVGSKLRAAPKFRKMLADFLIQNTLKKLIAKFCKICQF